MLWWLPLVPILAGTALLVSRLPRRLWIGAFAVAALLLTLTLSIVATLEAWSGSFAWSDVLRLQAALTPLSAAVAILVPTIALPVLAFAAADEARAGLTRLIALLLVFVGGMELLVIADDLLTLLIGWEFVGACSWALISHEWRDVGNPRSGLYAFVTTRLGDLGLFIAAMATFATTGGFAYEGLRSLDADTLSIVAFGVLLSAAAKSGQVPFSPWLFRAMAGPSSVSALLHAATMVAAGAYLLARLHPVLSEVYWFGTAAIAIGLATALTGGVVALLQNHAKKLLAASTSAHYGLMFVAVGADYPGVAILHLVAHAGFKALLFLAAGTAGERAGSYALDRMQFGRTLPVMAGLIAAGALSLAGVPPLGGGWTKEAVIAAAGHEQGLFAAGCMVAGGLSAAYAMRFQLLAYGFAGDPGRDKRPPAAEYSALGTLALFSLVLSALWLPSVHDGMGRLLGAEIPTSKTGELIASLGLVGLGLLVGSFLARRYPGLGTDPHSGAAAAWLGLPSLISVVAVRPFERCAGAAAWVDDRLVDAGRRAVATLGTNGADAAARLDRRAVDGGRRAVAAFGTALAQGSARFGEWAADGLPYGTAQLVGMSGDDLRRLQTGLTHHYYALLAVGVAVMAAILLVGP